VTKLKDKPFALVGVNVVAHKPDELKAVMDKENLNWRSFDDDGTIHRQWNSTPTPTFYVLDSEGVIQHKWVGHPGEEVVDAAVEALLE
jgi:peroxiredoxin